MPKDSRENNEKAHTSTRSELINEFKMQGSHVPALSKIRIFRINVAALNKGAIVCSEHNS